MQISACWQKLISFIFIFCCCIGHTVLYGGDEKFNFDNSISGIAVLFNRVFNTHFYMMSQLFSTHFYIMSQFLWTQSFIQWHRSSFELFYIMLQFLWTQSFIHWCRSSFEHNLLYTDVAVPLNTIFYTLMSRFL